MRQNALAKANHRPRCVNTRCGKVVRDTESQVEAQSQPRQQPRQQQRRWGDSSRSANAGVHLERVQGRQVGGHARAPPPRYVLRDENGVTVVEEAPPVYSVTPPR